MVTSKFTMSLRPLSRLRSVRSVGSGALRLHKTLFILFLAKVFEHLLAKDVRSGICVHVQIDGGYLPLSPTGKEVMFSPLFVCLSVYRISQNIININTKNCGRIQMKFCGQVRCERRTN